MGFSYLNGKLCCDYCGSTGARKYKCPYGYCPSWAACPECRKLHAKDFTKNAHAKCKTRHEEFVAEEQKRLAVINNGGEVRCAALQHGDKVKVIFRAAEKETAYFMNRQTYAAIPLFQIATPEDYSRVGAVVPAANLDIYDPN